MPLKLMLKFQLFLKLRLMHLEYIEQQKIKYKNQPAVNLIFKNENAQNIEAHTKYLKRLACSFAKLKPYCNSVDNQTM